ncbi:HET protein, partial [Coniophora puteana RWD-64-598 SS2]
MGQAALAFIRTLGLFTEAEDDSTPTRNLDNAEQGGPLCGVCSKLDLHGYLYNGLPREQAMQLGSISDVLEKSGSCVFCSLVAAIIRRGWLLDAKEYNFDPSTIQLSLHAMACGCINDPVPPTQQLAHRLYIQTPDRPPEVYAAITVAGVGLMLDIQLMEEDAKKMGRTRELHGRRVSETVDLDLVRNWMDICCKEHGDACESVWWRGTEETLPDAVRMVDVLDEKIVTAPTGARYLALSYLWGGIGESYWTTAENLPARMQPGGLPLSILPATISDAILLTRELGERYLWVDALCIVQDGPADKAVQISVMELIYGSAALTIFAAGGTNANAPLPGLRRGTRMVHQRAEHVQGLHLAVPLPTLLEAFTKTAWNTRGWTYQELMLSRRRLFFTQEQVYFEC